MQQTDTLRNMPVVPDKSKASIRLNGTSAELHRVWFQGKVGKFFSFYEAPLAAAGGNVPLSPIYVTFNINQCQPNGGPGSGFTPSQTLRKLTTCRSRCRATRDTPRCGWLRSTTTPIFRRCTTGQLRSGPRCSLPGWRPSIARSFPLGLSFFSAGVSPFGPASSRPFFRPWRGARNGHAGSIGSAIFPWAGLSVG